MRYISSNLTDFEKHLIKFSKGHYNNSPSVDLNTIAAYHLGLYVEQVTTPMLMRLVIKTYEKLVHMNRLNHSYEDTINLLFKKNLYSGGDGSHITREDIIFAFIGEISTIVVNDHKNNIYLDLGYNSNLIIKWGEDKRVSH